MVEDRHYTTKEVAAIFNVSQVYIIKMCNDGRIRASKPFGTSWRIPTSEVERMSKGQKRDPGQPLSPKPPPEEDPPRKVRLPEHVKKYVAGVTNENIEEEEEPDNGRHEEEKKKGRGEKRRGGGFPIDFTFLDR